MHEPIPKNYGFCDGLFNRESNSPWKDYQRQSEYVKGYMQGQTLRMQGAGTWLLKGAGNG